MSMDLSPRCSCEEPLGHTSGPSHVCKRFVMLSSGVAPGAGAYPVLAGQTYTMNITTDPNAWIDQLSDAALDRLVERLAPRIEQALLRLARMRGTP